MENFKKDLACNISLISVLTFTLVHILILTLNLFGVINLKLHIEFNYLVAYALVIVCLALYIFGFFVSKFKNLSIPSWFRILFYVAFFLFTNTYYIAGLYHSIVAKVFLFAYIAFLINIISLSAFFNIQKDEKNRLKSTATFLITSVFMYSVATCALFQFVISIVKALAFPSYEFSTLLVFVVEMSAMLLVTIITTIVMSMSLKRSKALINACLIKTGPKASARTVKK